MLVRQGAADLGRVVRAKMGRLSIEVDAFYELQNSLAIPAEVGHGVRLGILSRVPGLAAGA